MDLFYIILKNIACGLIVGPQNWIGLLKMNPIS